MDQVAWFQPTRSIRRTEGFNNICTLPLFLDITFTCYRAWRLWIRRHDIWCQKDIQSSEFKYYQCHQTSQKELRNTKWISSKTYNYKIYPYPSGRVEKDQQLWQKIDRRIIYVKNEKSHGWNHHAGNNKCEIQNILLTNLY